MKNWPLVRDVTLFFGGLAGITHETLQASVERPSLLVVFAAMMGLPAFLNKGNGNGNGRNGNNQ